MANILYDGKTPIGNGIANATTYTTEEQAVGTWIDGKTIYRKVITATTPESITDGELAIKEISLGFTPKMLTRLEGTVAESETTLIPFPTAWTYGSINYFVNTYIKGSTIILQTNRASYAGKNVYFTIEYTKA